MIYPPTSNERYKNLLFVDQSLEELVTQHQSGYESFGTAYQQICQGDTEAAKQTLKVVLKDPSEEIRRHLWAWKALRDLGEVPPAEISSKVHGVVFEIPLAEWTDTLAVYSDGRVRYLNGQVGTSAPVIWEATDDPSIRPLVAVVIEAAKSVIGQAAVVATHVTPSPTRQPRISVLTFGGIHSLDRDEFTSHITDPVLSCGTHVFVTLMERLRSQSEN